MMRVLYSLFFSCSLKWSTQHSFTALYAVAEEKLVSDNIIVNRATNHSTIAGNSSFIERCLQNMIVVTLRNKQIHAYIPSQVINLRFRLSFCSGNLFMSNINNGWQMKSISHNLLSIIIIPFNKVIGFESTLHINLQFNRYSYYLFLF